MLDVRTIFVCRRLWVSHLTSSIAKCHKLSGVWCKYRYPATHTQGKGYQNLSIAKYRSFWLTSWLRDIRSLAIAKMNWMCWNLICQSLKLFIRWVHVSVQTLVRSCLVAHSEADLPNLALISVSYSAHESKSPSHSLPTKAKARLLENSSMNQRVPLFYFIPLPKQNMMAIPDCGQLPQPPKKHPIKIRSVIIG